MRGYRWLLAVGLIAAGVPAVRIGLARDQAAPKAERTDRAAKATLSALPTQRQVTAFAILAIPDSAELDPRLASVQGQLKKVLPGHGFRLRDVQSRRIDTGQAVTCDLGDGYKAETVLVKPLDDNGKVQLRCNLTFKGTREFSTLIRSPVNQLVFYERALKPGTRVLIGVGAR